MDNLSILGESILEILEFLVSLLFSSCSKILNILETFDLFMVRPTLSAARSKITFMIIHFRIFKNLYVGGYMTNIEYK